MKKKLIIILILVYMGICFISCNTQASNDKNNVNAKPTDTVAKEIPLDRNRKPDLYYRVTKQKARQLKLDSLELGYDSIQIRIWFDYSLAITKHLIVIKNKNDMWSGQLFTMQTKYNTSTDSEIIINKSIKDVQPPMGWENFMKSLFALNIATLSEGPEGGMDGVSYNIEFATKHQYRFYEYWSPETTQSKFDGSKNMVKIIDLLENECNFKRSQH